MLAAAKKKARALPEDPFYSSRNFKNALPFFLAGLPQKLALMSKNKFFIFKRKDFYYENQ